MNDEAYFSSLWVQKLIGIYCLSLEESRGRLHKWAAKRARLLEDAATDAITSGAAQADNGDLPSKDTVGAVAVDMSGMAAAGELKLASCSFSKQVRTTKLCYCYSIIHQRPVAAAYC